MARLSAKKNAKVVVRIPGLRHALEQGSTENLWQTLRRAFLDIQQKRDTGRRFDELYRFAYDMVAHDESALLYHGLRETVTEHLVNKVRPSVLASGDDTFLQTLNQAWSDHQRSMNMIADIVMYLDQVYVPKNNVCSVHNLGLVLFRDNVARYDDVRDKLREMLLQMINRDREGEVVDRPLVKDACQMLIKVGVDSRSVYEEDFERSFLDESAKFYSLESQKHLAENDAIAYIDMAEQRIVEESERARHCLDPSTDGPIGQVVFQELVANHVKAIAEMEGSGVVHMLETQNSEELSRAFRLLSRAENGLKTIAQCMSKYLREQGRSFMPQKGDDGDPFRLVNNVLDLKDRFDHILQTSFNNEHIFRQTMNADFEYILSLSSKSAEYVAIFADDMLRKGIRGMTQQEIEQVLDKIVAVFRFLPDKDIFERYYKHHLCQRLLLNKFASHDAEKSLVLKLKTQCGCMYTSKFEIMFKDMYISKTMTEEFKAAVASSGIDLQGLDMRMRVLTTGFWPFPAAIQQSNIPAAPSGAYETFRRFYLAKHTGRLLTLQPQLGWADLSAVFCGQDQPSTSSAPSVVVSRPRTYIIVVSTYQMCVLMLFNNRDRIPYEDIASETAIPVKDLVRALLSLSAGKATERILNKEPETDDIGPGHAFTVNESFTSEERKVKIQPTTTNKESRPKDRERVVVNVDEERRFELEAAIVRIMKKHLKLSHDELVAELINLLSARYTPSSEAIRKRIDALIDREYLERAPEDGQVYTYIP
ncbi:hypothetical protein V5799_026169 [Amblyomma americanum]|uniref:Cullin family profile domain-containing protein n=1 Tax=Amblyomma americanum TaxID=6943 RepID=A0AAQ4DJC7_AMBAM